MNATKRAPSTRKVAARGPILDDGGRPRPWYHQHAETVIQLNRPGQCGRFTGWLARMGFTYTEGMDWNTGFWNRFHNVRHADQLHGYDGYKVRNYSRGVLGVQMESTRDGVRARVWRTLSNPETAAERAPRYASRTQAGLYFWTERNTAGGVTSFVVVAQAAGGPVSEACDDWFRNQADAETMALQLAEGRA